MIIEQTFTVDAPPQKTAAFFIDIEQVSSCIPGVEGVTETAPGEYAATLAVRLGPIKTAFQGSITLNDEEAPQRLKASGHGRDRATNSSVKVDFTADLLEEHPGVTTVRAVADLTIRGKLSQFGTGVMRAAAGEIVQEFAACANARLTAQESASALAEAFGEGAEQSTSTTTLTVRPQRGIVNIVLRGLMRSAAAALRATADQIDARLGATGKRP